MPDFPSIRLPKLTTLSLRTRLAEAARLVHGTRGVPAPAGHTNFRSASFTGPAGTRPYKLYVPATYAGKPVPLMVMLHGCTQSPDDFATGTGMNQAADRDNFLVLYPAQTQSANASKCWNWFNPPHQARESGEPALIAGMIHQVEEAYKIDPRRIYIAGLSAGGALAAIMADAYPDLFAAACIHSGIACGAARDMMSALTIMRQGPPIPTEKPRTSRKHLPVILFQGDRDNTVNARNIDGILHQFDAARLKPKITPGTSPTGQPFTCTQYQDADGITMIEQWTIHGAGHAWSGGSAAGSFTDPKGPDATKEMLRFFHAHPRG
jgi:poly(hydroxyalkanoate) depolymerase family esterase